MGQHFYSLIALLPAGSPERRLEAYLAIEAVIAWVQNTPGRVGILRLDDASKIATVSRLPLLAVRTAIAKLIQPQGTPPVSAPRPRVLRIDGPDLKSSARVHSTLQLSATPARVVD